MSPRKHVVPEASADSGGLRPEVRDLWSQRVALVRGPREFAEAITPRTLPRTRNVTFNPCNLWLKTITQIMELPVNPPILPMLAKLWPES